MTTVNVDSLLVGRPLAVGANSTGYSRKKILIPNVPTQGADSVSSLTIGAAGTGFTSIPDFDFESATGSGAAATGIMKALTATVATSQSGGGSYAPSDLIVLAETTASIQPILTVATTKVVSATVFAGGSGGTDGTQTVTGTTGTGAKFQASVTVSGGAITAVLSITVAGNYTANPSSNDPVTGASLTGAQLSVVTGVLTATTTTAGSITALAATPVAQGSTSGTGTGATFTMTYGVLGATVTNGGADYATAPTVAITGGGGTGATATAVIGGTDDPITVSLAFSPALPTSSYTVNATPSQGCSRSYANKTVTGVDITLTPLDGETLVSGSMDVVIGFTS
jgi:hypothetical protein